MAIKNETTRFSMYSPRQLSRTTFNSFNGSGIDLFTDRTAMSPNAFLSLTNLLPSSDGGFSRRWGMRQKAVLTQSAPVSRMFTYAAHSDPTISSVDTFAIFATDNTNFYCAYEEAGSYLPPLSPTFTGATDVFAVCSRAYLYAMNGADYPRKYNFSLTGGSGNWSLMGLPTPTYNTRIGSTVPELYTGVAGTGNNYSNSPTVSFSGGGGSGASAQAVVVDGVITQFIMLSGGTGYSSAPTVTVTDGTGSGATSITAVVDLDSTSSTHGQVTAVLLTGPMQLNVGRRYAVAFRDSVTGVTSDFLAGTQTVRPVQIVSSIGNSGSSSYQNVQTGVDVIKLRLSIGSLPITNPTSGNFDTVILLATADGGDLSTLYEVAQWNPIPGGLIQNPVGAFSTYTFLDQLPDTVSDHYLNGATLLTQNIWSEPDGAGNYIGIQGNTSPYRYLTKPVLHKGRLFATDGKSLFFSKSLAEVTTSTGLITSRWEEAWPGDYVLDIAYGDESINALLSDGDVLYIGTGKNIYRLLGDSPSNFAIPTTIFRGVGVLSQDCWSVFYKDDIPAGYMWTTPDQKLMISDFNTYNEVGKYIYPLLPTIGTPQQIQSVSYGPYSLAIISLGPTNNGLNYLVYDTKDSGWYIWNRQFSATAGITGITAAALLSYTDSTGVSRAFSNVRFARGGTVSNTLQFFEPTATFDNPVNDGPDFSPAATINYDIATAYTDFGDSTAFRVLNDMEVWTQDAANMIVEVYKNSSTFGFPGTLLKSGQLVNGPLGMKKFYLAGVPTASRYHYFRFYSQVPVGGPIVTTNAVLQQFNLEHFPQVRI